MALPSIIENGERQWERALEKIDEDSTENSKKLEAMFKADPGYIAFKEKYPESGDHFRYHGAGSGEITITVMNFKTFDKLSLELKLEKNNHKISYYGYCEKYENDDKRKLRMHGDLAIPFVLESDCLANDGQIASPTDLTDKNGNSMLIKNTNDKYAIQHERTKICSKPDPFSETEICTIQ